MASADPVGRGRSVAGLKEIVQLVEDDLVKVEALFAEHLRSDVPLVGEMGRYILEGGGKRIRPALLLLACRACGYRGDRAILLASVVELIHTATLVHDDIIDEATVRRGRRSANSRWATTSRCCSATSSIRSRCRSPCRRTTCPSCACCRT